MASINDLINAGIDPDAQLAIIGEISSIGTQYRICKDRHFLDGQWDEAGRPVVVLGTEGIIGLSDTPPQPRIRVHVPDVIAGISLTHDEARELRAQITRGLGDYVAVPTPEIKAGDTVRIVGPSLSGDVCRTGEIHPVRSVDGPLGWVTIGRPNEPIIASPNGYVQESLEVIR